MNQSGRRNLTLTGVEVRDNADGSVKVTGHAAVFDSPTTIGGGPAAFEERIARGAFSKTIEDKADVRFLYNHNPDLVLARTKSGTLTLREDGVGLAVDADLAPTSVGRDLAVLLQRGDVSQMSFGFQVVKEKWETAKRDDGGTRDVRTVLEARLFDVSAVTYPAYDETDIALREATLARELRGVPVPTADARAAMPASVMSDDADDDPETLAQAVDESLDAALAAWDDNPAQAKALVVAAAAAIDALLASIGVSDPDETGEGRSATTSPEPAEATRRDEVDERSMPLPLLLIRHAEGAHVHLPSAVCSACVRSEPETSTPA